ncbi:hypothetical protein [Tahibacter caeni]|uniref:hypothetical protein n=1 Tax=Tahibacter caeni TaxID=1453545 RepID=UPI002147A284|nr:hypothetical protein [Tahibacter caeni]
MSHNPYAPPEARVVGRAASFDGAQQVWRAGDRAVFRPGDDLPPRCVKCNADAEQPVKERAMHWHTPWLYLLLLVSILIYVIVALIVRKSAKVSPGLCAEHRLARRNIILGSWLAALAGMGLMALSIDRSSGPLALLAAAVMLGSLIFGMVKGRIVYPTHIDAQRIELKGCGEAFLASLPQRR